MNIKKRMVVTSAFLTLTVVLLFTDPMITQAAEYIPETWVPRSVQEVKTDIAKHENSRNYLLIWGDTLSIISEATGDRKSTRLNSSHL